MTKPKALVLHAAGTNRDPDACVALGPGRSRARDRAYQRPPGGRQAIRGLRAARHSRRILVCRRARRRAPLRPRPGVLLLRPGRRLRRRREAGAGHLQRFSGPRQGRHPPRDAGRTRGEPDAQPERPLRVPLDRHGGSVLKLPLDQESARPDLLPGSPRRGPLRRRLPGRCSSGSRRRPRLRWSTPTIPGFRRAARTLPIPTARSPT